MANPREDWCMSYETAIRKAHDDCQRYGDPDKLADADVVRGGDWGQIAKGLTSALNKSKTGGTQRDANIDRAIKFLEGNSNKENYAAALCHILTALNCT